VARNDGGASLNMRGLTLILFFASTLAAAGDMLVMVDTRPGVKVGYWVMPREGAKATVVLLPGGEGGIGMKDGVPTSGNFLVRSRDLFAAQGFNVAIVGKPSDRGDLDGFFRASAPHVEDLRVVIERLRKDLGQPVWLIGTSRGTISAAAAAIALDPSLLAGIVLTSSVTQGARAMPVPSLALPEIRVPVLVVHHRRDACPSCQPHDAAYIVSRLTRAPVKKLLMLDGGSGARGDPCEPWHWHGFIGMESEAVGAIADWVRNPMPEKP
jgi:pimeloyl-ACP methyl ester carboxylesterase